MRVSDSVEMGLAMRKRRKKLGYTQQFLSDITGLSVSFISDIERGKETAEFGKVLYLVNLLGMDLEIRERQ